MEEINLKDLANYFVSKIIIVVVIMVAVLWLGNIYSLVFKTPMYKSTSTLVLVNESNNNSAITQSDITLNNNLVSTYTEIIKSRNVLEKVIKNLKLDMTAKELSNKISVSSTTNTQLITVNVMDSNNKEARKIAREIDKVFIEETSKIYKINNVAVVDEASLEKSPYNMNVIKENIIYLFVGIVLSVGTILVMYTFDTSIKSVEDVEEKLELTVLGSVPKVGEM